MDAKNYVLVKTHEPDLDRFAELVIAAKGDRTMQAFAHACGFTPATFTRITKKMNTGPSRANLIEAIAANAAPETEVTLELLADANGYSLVEDPIRYERAKHASSIGKNSRTRLARDIIIQEFLDRNQAFTICSPRHKITESFDYKPDMLIRTNAFEDHEVLWLVDCIYESIGPHSPEYPIPLQGEAVFHKIADYTLMTLSRGFLDMSMRFSLVVFNFHVFVSILRLFDEIRTPAQWSLILIDEINGCIEAEEMLGPNRGDRSKSFFMSTPKNSHQQS